MNSGPTLTIGSTGADVRRLQVILVMTKLLDYRQIDGAFGPKTQAAVKSFQQGNNLTADGVVGSMTWKALPADPNTPRLMRGSTGTAVTAVQKGLRTFGGTGTATDPGPADGSYGPKYGPNTEAAVKTLQQQRSVPVDGIVGPATWAIIDALENEGPVG